MGLSLLVPLLVLLALGRIELGVYALFGTFAGVYGGRSVLADRWRRQAALAAVLATAVTLGALVAGSVHREWLAVPVCALWAMAVAAASDRFGWTPPGPLIPLFALATCAAIPTSGATDVARAAACVVAAATWTVALGVLEVRFTGERHYPVPTHPATGVPPRRRVVHAVRCAVGVAVSGSIAVLLGIGHPYWAMVATVVPLSVPGLTAQLARGLNRLIGTVVGLVLAAGLLSLHLPVWSIVLLTALLQAGTELVIVRHYGAALVLITPAALLMGQFGSAQPAHELLTDRLLETAIGVVVGGLVAVATRQAQPGRRSSPDPAAP